MAKKRAAAAAATTKPPPIPNPLPEKELLHARAQRLLTAVQAQSFPLAVNTRFGLVQFASLVVKTDARGLDYVEIYTAGATVNNDPHWRIWNPPLLVEDRENGDIVIGNTRFREDPIQAIAEAIAQYGGRQKNKGLA